MVLGRICESTRQDKPLEIQGERILVMSKQSKFTAEFKQQVIQKLLSGVSNPVQLPRRYEISSGLLYLYHLKKQYIKICSLIPPTRNLPY